jgi:hypothetical protein
MLVFTLSEEYWAPHVRRPSVSLANNVYTFSVSPTRAQSDGGPAYAANFHCSFLFQTVVFSTILLKFLQLLGLQWQSPSSRKVQLWRLAEPWRCCMWGSSTCLNCYFDCRLLAQLMNIIFDVLCRRLLPPAWPLGVAFYSYL